MSAWLRLKNSMIRGSCNPRLMFQHTTLTELGEQRSHRGLAKLPVSISGTEVTISLLRTIHSAKVMGVVERPQPKRAHFLFQTHPPLPSGSQIIRPSEGCK